MSVGLYTAQKPPEVIKAKPSGMLKTEAETEDKYPFSHGLCMSRCKVAQLSSDKLLQAILRYCHLPPDVSAVMVGLLVQSNKSSFRHAAIEKLLVLVQELNNRNCLTYRFLQVVSIYHGALDLAGPARSI